MEKEPKSDSLMLLDVGFTSKRMTRYYNVYSLKNSSVFKTIQIENYRAKQKTRFFILSDSVSDTASDNKQKLNFR